MKQLRIIALIGWVLMVASFVFAIAETWWFGWNRYPETQQELYADAVVLIICFIGSSLFVFALVAETVIEVKKLFK